MRPSIQSRVFCKCGWLAGGWTAHEDPTSGLPDGALSGRVAHTPTGRPSPTRAHCVTGEGVQVKHVSVDLDPHVVNDVRVADDAGRRLCDDNFARVASPLDEGLRRGRRGATYNLLCHAEASVSARAR